MLESTEIVLNSTKIILKPYYWIKSYFVAGSDNIMKVHYIIGNTSEIANLVNCGVKRGFNFTSRCYASYSCADNVYKTHITYKAKSKIGMFLSLTGTCADISQWIDPSFNNTMITLPISIFCKTGFRRLIEGGAINLII